MSPEGLSARRGGTVLALLLGASALLLPARAEAFCLTRACDPKQTLCTRDARGCVQQGERLFWPSSCVTMSLQQDAAPSQDISYEAALEVLTAGLEAWTSAECEGGGSPSIRTELSEPVECALLESNPDGMNANVVMFRENEWPYVGAIDAYGFTRLRFGTESGHILDADIELNAASDPFSIGDPVTGIDLASVLTHELGHMLGLDHSNAEDATMFPGYVSGDDSLRSLHPDDIAGLCDIYPPEREPESTSCEPRGGFSKLCLADQPPPSAGGTSGTGGSNQDPPPPDGGDGGGCSISQNGAPPGWWLLGGAVVAACWRRRTLRNSNAPSDFRSPPRR